MPLKRTPPKTSHKSQSNPEIDSCAVTDSGLSEATTHLRTPVTTRCKRLREESISPRAKRAEADDFKAELKEMMLTFQKNQTLLLNKMLGDIAEIKAQNQTIQKSNLEIEKVLDSIKAGQDQLAHRIDKSETERLSIINNIQKLQSEISNLELSARSRLAFDIQRIDVRDVYRLPGKPDKPRIVVTEFARVDLKINFLVAIRRYNSNRSKADKLKCIQLGIEAQNDPIYVSEFIAGDRRKLFYLCREFTKVNNFKFCWSLNNKIYIRQNEHARAIRIDSESALDQIMK
ncbi:hypothetical protein ACJJTC_014634 [Scirpophaga incertulas]